jgi:hypothetical protein
MKALYLILLGFRWRKVGNQMAGCKERIPKLLLFLYFGAKPYFKFFPVVKSPFQLCIISHGSQRSYAWRFRNSHFYYVISGYPWLWQYRLI